MKTFLFVVSIVLGLTILRLSLYTVDAAEYVYVTVLGKHRITHDGEQAEGAGLKFGWPWPIQQVQRLDRRLQQFDLPAMEQLTHEGKTIDKILLIEAYVCWKIADEDAVDRFVKRIGTADRARAILAPLINSQLGAEIGQMHMDDLVNTPDEDHLRESTRADTTIEKLRRKLLDHLHDQVHAEYGIDLCDIRLRRFNHPASVRESIFQRIKSERNKKIAEHQSKGELLASNIASEAEAYVREKLAEARSKEEKIKAEADMEAIKIRNQAYSQDPEFYAFLKKMEKLQSILGDNKTMLLLSTNRAMFESLFQPPRARAETDKDRDPVKNLNKKEEH